MSTISWKAAEEQRRKAKAHHQRECKHRAYGDNEWAIGLQHNFPDMQPRGICYLCNFVIQPRHWVDWVPGGTPGSMTIVTASMLFPVVTAIERRDYALDFLNRIYIAAVDFLQSDELALTIWIDWVDAQARKAVRQQCEDDTAIYRS